MRNSLRLLALFVYCAVFAQENTESKTDNYGLTPFNPKSRYYNIDVRGIAAFYPWGNGGGAVAGFGFDVGIGRRQSLGLEAIYYTYGDAEDEVTDNEGVTHQDGGNRTCARDNAIFLNYRYYLNWQWQRSKGYAPYISAFARYGRLVKMQDQNFPGNEYTMETDIQKSAGIVLGSIYTFEESNFGIDVNVGAFYKTHDIKTDYIELFDGGIVASKQSNFGIRVGFSINYWFDFKRKGAQ
jgi:hypothetical protein